MDGKEAMTQKFEEEIYKEEVDFNKDVLENYWFNRITDVVLTNYSQRIEFYWDSNSGLKEYNRLIKGNLPRGVINRFILTLLKNERNKNMLKINWKFWIDTLIINSRSNGPFIDIDFSYYKKFFRNIIPYISDDIEVRNFNISNKEFMKIGKD